MIKDLSKTPFPWFGGKTDAAPAVWSLLGDVPHYVEPFFGGGAVLLRRPHPCNRTYYSETVNDANGLLVNAWRAIQMSPDATAEAASWPVTEADLMARHIALVRWERERELERLMADPTFHDPVIAGWWLWGICSWIGGGWCDGKGPWRVGADGRIEKQGRAPREPGVNAQRPQLTNGMGVNHAGTREPGVKAQRPQLTNDGRGVNHAGTREPGVCKQRPQLTDDGRGVNRPKLREPGVGEEEFHSMTMPELLRWLRFLSARLRHVRIINGDWARAVTTGAAFTLPVRQGKGPAGVFLDPPYSLDVRDGGLYATDSAGLSGAAREWCLANGGDKRFRIVLAGFEGEGHEALVTAGWKEYEWYKGGFLRGGMANQGQGTKQHRERLWASPHCLAGGEEGEKGKTGEGLFEED